MGNLDMDDLSPPEFSIDKANHLENMDGNYGGFYSQLQNFNTETYYNNALTMLKVVSTLLKENTRKLTVDFSDCICEMCVYK